MKIPAPAVSAVLTALPAALLVSVLSPTAAHAVPAEPPVRGGCTPVVTGPVAYAVKAEHSSVKTVAVGRTKVKALGGGRFRARTEALVEVSAHQVVVAQLEGRACSGAATRTYAAKAPLSMDRTYTRVGVGVDTSKAAARGAARRDAEARARKTLRAEVAKASRREAYRGARERLDADAARRAVARPDVQWVGETRHQ